MYCTTTSADVRSICSRTQRSRICRTGLLPYNIVSIIAAVIVTERHQRHPAVREPVSLPALAFFRNVFQSGIRIQYGVSVTGLNGGAGAGSHIEDTKLTVGTEVPALTTDMVYSSPPRARSCMPSSSRDLAPKAVLMFCALVSWLLLAEGFFVIGTRALLLPRLIHNIIFLVRTNPA